MPAQVLVHSDLSMEVTRIPVVGNVVLHTQILQDGNTTNARILQDGNITNTMLHMYVYLRILAVHIKH